MSRPLLVILAAITLDAVGIGLIFPILPALLRELTLTTEVAAIYGVILAVYALMQFLFAPVLGMLSDRYGRRPVLLVSLAGAAIDYLIMAFAPSLWLVFIGRAIAGITAANLAVATAYLADITPEEDRAGRFGYLHACFGVGFILGPIIGGILGDVWVRAPFIAAAVLNAANFALALFLLPESHRGERSPLSLRGLNPVGPLRWALAFAALLPLMAIYFMLNLIGQLYGTVWVLYGEDQFQWTGTMVGISLAAFGVFHAGAQAFLTGPVTKRIGERSALLLGMVSETIALTILAFVTQTWMVFALLPLFALGGVGVPALQSMLSNEVGPDKQGQLQGVLASLLSLTSVFGPLIFSWVYFYAHTDWPGFIWLLGAGLYCFTAPLLLAVRKRSPALQ
jgi:MFS transporter, DHA1 family, tetracycline resistance protein